MTDGSADFVELPADLVVRLVELAEENKRLAQRFSWRRWRYGFLTGASGGLIVGGVLCRFGALP
jgi:hypothetical protein